MNWNPIKEGRCTHISWWQAKCTAFVWYEWYDADLCPIITFIDYQRSAWREEKESNEVDQIFVFFNNKPESPPQMFWVSSFQPMPHIVEEITTFGPNILTHCSFNMIRLSTQFNFGDSSPGVCTPFAAWIPDDNEILFFTLFSFFIVNNHH